MRNRIISLLLVISMLLGLCLSLTACDGDGGAGGGGANYATEDLDLLTLSLNRLENADLSFNFNIGKSSAAQNVASSGSQIKAAAAGDEDYYFTPDTMITNQIDYNIFNDYQTSIGSMSEQARKIADDMVDKITVMNTPVRDIGNRFLYLSYDSEKDILFASEYYDPKASPMPDSEFSDEDDGSMMGSTNGTGGASLSEPYGNMIKIYYDEKGNEVIEYSAVHNTTSDGTIFGEKIIYSNDSKYAFITFNKQPGKEKFSVHYVGAEKVDGVWRGIDMSADTSSHVLDEELPIPEGVYRLVVDFYHEDEVMYIIRDGLMRDENGLHLEGASLAVPGLYITSIFERNIGNLQINMSLLDGWTEYGLFLNDEEKTQPYSEYYFNEGDYINFANGMVYKIEPMSISPTYVQGIDQIVRHEGENDWYIDDETAIPKKDSDLGGRINGVTSLIDNHDISLHSQSNMFIDIFGHTQYQQFLSLAYIMEIYGLSFNDNLPENFIDKFSETMRNQAIHQNITFNLIFGKDFTPENTKAAMLELSADMQSEYETFNTFVTENRSKEFVKINELPVRPPELGLIDLKDNISGIISVSDSGIDFSALSANVKKCILLSGGKNYTLLTYLASGEDMVLIEGFEGVSYANADFTLTGRSVSLPKIEKDGEYYLYGCIAKAEGSEYTRLSDLVKLSTAPFTGFTKTTEENGGTYTQAFSQENGALKVSSYFDDKTAPVVSISDIEENDGVYTVPAVDVTQILSKITAKDNKDGNIVITNLHFLDEDSRLPVAENAILVAGTTYVLSVTDTFGNITEIVFEAVN